MCKLLEYYVAAYKENSY